ncbi:hypothetical protein CBS101457_000892 [Exobasidium rhododendri]|nr:hypothetical protein CBS101457_000892 [Exobasidium rhododendri]
MAEHVITLDLSNVSKAYSVLGGFIVIYGLVSYIAKDRLYLSEPLIAVTVGIITGPYVLGWIDPNSWGATADTNYVTYEFTRLVVGVQVLFTGISLPKAYLRKEALSLVFLLLGVMTVAWFVSALIIWGLIPNLTYLESLAISAAITPTDPVLANSITKGRFAEKHVPTNLRNIIVAESGANDGLGFPFLFLAIYLLARSGGEAGTSIGTEVGRWVYGVIIYRILLSMVYGAIVGVLAHKTLKWAETRGYIDRDNFFAYGFGLALFTLGTTGLFNSDDIFGCFIAGNAFTWKDWYRVRTQVEEEDSFQDILDSLLNAAVFIYIGAIIPWSEYSSATSVVDIAPWRIVLMGICIIVLRRLPWVVAMWKAIPAITSFSEALFAGWFGPIGVGAVFYIQVALREIPDDGTRDRLRAVYTPVVLFCVFSSVLTHGVTIPIAKLGPGIVRRTTSFSAQRTISLTTKPRKGSPNNSVDEGTSPGANESSSSTAMPPKEVWNPLWSLAWGIKSVVLVWRKDSFWRKETKHQKRQRQQKVLQSHSIGKPMNATAMSTMMETRAEREQNQKDQDQIQESNSNGEEGISLQSEVQPQQPVVIPEPIANIKDKQHAEPRSVGIIQIVGNSLREEWQAENREAIREAMSKVHGDLGQRGESSSSIPGTPNGSRVRFIQQD